MKIEQAGIWQKRQNPQKKGLDIVSYYVFFTANGLLDSFELSDDTPYIHHDHIYCQNQSFPSVFLFRGGDVLVKYYLDDYTITDCGANFSENLPVYDGMYLCVTRKKDGKHFELMILHKESLPIGHKYFYLEQEVIIGNGETARIKSAIPNSLSHEHAKIYKQGNLTMVSSMDEGRDVYVNGIKVENKRLASGDMIWCMGLSLVFMGDYLSASSKAVVQLDEYTPKMVEPPIDEETMPQIERSPRVTVPLDRSVVEILPPSPKEHSVPSVATIKGPSFVMSLGMLISAGYAAANVLNYGDLTGLMTSGISAFTFLIGALLWPGMVRKHHKKEQNKRNENRQEKYALYAEEKTKELEEKYNRNRKIWNEMLAPTPESLVKMAEKHQADNRLWERTPEDADFLELRLGLGNHPFEVSVKIPSDPFNPEDDELRSYPEIIANKYKVLKDVPEVLSMVKEKQVGVWGQMDRVYQMMTALMLETMALHSPEVVKTVCLFSEHEKEHFLWAKDLPSMWSNDQSVRFMAATPEQAHSILRHIDQRITNHPNDESYLLFVTNRNLLQQEAIGRYLKNPDSSNNLFSIFFGETLSALPKECRAVVRSTANYGGLYHKQDNMAHFIQFTQDPVDENLLCEFKQAMLQVPFSFDQSKVEIMEKVGFLELFHCGNVEDLEVAERWHQHGVDKSLATPLGLAAGDVPFSLDIHPNYHGFHGMVVGESDTDKTALMQSLVLSHMVSHSPEDLVVMLMEFNHSGFVRSFGQAPHIVGRVESVEQCQTVMAPLRGEVTRRKKIFHEAAVSLGLDSMDINVYHKYLNEKKVSEKIPHILVAVDEFVPLLRQAPALFGEMLYLVKVGRSYGIHFVASTANPHMALESGIGCHFRICLNLSNPDDVMSLLSVPYSASLRRAGRCFVQVGQNEVFAEIQSGNCQQNYIKMSRFMSNHEMSVDVIDFAGRKINRRFVHNAEEVTKKTQLEAVVEHLIQVACEERITVTMLDGTIAPVMEPPVVAEIPAEIPVEVEETTEWAQPEAEYPEEMEYTEETPVETEAETYEEPQVEMQPEAEPEVYAEPVAEVQSAPQPEVEPELDTEPVAEVQAAPQPEVEPELDTEPVAEVQSAPQPEVYQEPVTEVQSAPQPEVYQEPVAEVQSAPQPEVYEEPVVEVPFAPQPEVEPELDTEPVAEVQAAPQPEAEPELDTEPVAEVQAAPQPEVEPELDTEPVAEVQSAPQPEVAPVPTPEYVMPPQVEAVKNAVTAEGVAPSDVFEAMQEEEAAFPEEFLAEEFKVYKPIQEAVAPEIQAEIPAEIPVEAPQPVQPPQSVAIDRDFSPTLPVYDEDDAEIMSHDMLDIPEFDSHKPKENVLPPQLPRELREPEPVEPPLVLPEVTATPRPSHNPLEFPEFAVKKGDTAPSAMVDMTKSPDEMGGFSIKSPPMPAKRDIPMAFHENPNPRPLDGVGNPVPAQTAQPAQAPVQPVQEIQQPVQPVQAPVQPVQAPVQPVQEFQQSVQPVQAPVQPVQEIQQPVQPVQEIQQPVQPVQAPVQPVQEIQQLVQPVQAPVQPVQEIQQPVQPVQAPVQPVQEIQQPVQPVQATEADKNLEAAREAFLNRVPQLPEIPRADFTTIQWNQGMFVGGNQQEVVQNLLLTLAKFNKVDYVFSSNGNGKCSNICDRLVWGEAALDSAIEEIREHAWSLSDEKCVILIPSFHEFCEVVSRRALDRLTRVLKKNQNKVAIITGDTPEFLAPYSQWDFLNVAVKQSQGVATNPPSLAQLLPYLADGLVPPTVELAETDFLYFYEKTWKILYL